MTIINGNSSAPARRPYCFFSCGDSIMLAILCPPQPVFARPRLYLIALTLNERFTLDGRQRTLAALSRPWCDVVDDLPILFLIEDAVHSVQRWKRRAHFKLNLLTTEKVSTVINVSVVKNNVQHVMSWHN